MSVDELLRAALGKGSSEDLTTSGSPPWISEAIQHDLFLIAVVSGLVSLSNMAAAKHDQRSPGHNAENDKRKCHQNFYLHDDDPVDFLFSGIGF